MRLDRPFAEDPVRANASSAVPPDATVEQRIAALESEARNLSRRIQATRHDFDRKITEHKDALVKEQHERNEQIYGTRKLSRRLSPAV